MQNTKMRRKKPTQDMKPRLSTAQQLNGFARNYNIEGSGKKIKVNDEDLEAARVRRRIEDIKQASALESDIINEVWD